MASPDLAGRVRQLLDSGEDASLPAIHRAVLATASYLMRWQRRVTPFGLFAGVTTATVGAAGSRDGGEHTAVARVDADWLTRVIDRLEQHRELRRVLLVAANNGAFLRDGRLHVEARPSAGADSPGPPREASTRFSPAVKKALAYAGRPVRFHHLSERLAADFRQADPVKVETMLHGLVDGGFLITNLRPPTIAEDALAHLLAALDTADAGLLPEIAALAEQLHAIHALLLRHNAVSQPTRQASIRSAAVATMARVAPGDGYPLAVDVRPDIAVSIPSAVLEEAAHAASVLLRLSTEPFGSAAWMDYHRRFRDRYGPGALVPVRDLVADSGLGYPAGYLGAPRARPAWRVMTERDAYLLKLIEQAILGEATEIALTDADIEAMTIGDPNAVVAPARIELGVTVDAPSPEALDAGRFVLRIIGAPRAYTSMAGRFAYLLDDADRQRLTATYTDGHSGVRGQ